MGMDIAIVAPTDWLPRHRVGFTLICEVEDEGFLHRDRLETRMQAWFDSLVFDALGALHIYIYP